MPFITALAGACFLISSFYLINDRAAVKATVTGNTDENRTLLNHGDYDEDGVIDCGNDEASDKNDDVVSDDVRGDDVRGDDATADTDGLLQPGYGIQGAMSSDNTSDAMETRPHLMKV